MLLLVGDILGTYGIVSLQYLFENLCLIVLKRAETLTAYYSVRGNPYDLINDVGPLLVICNHEIFIEVEFIHTLEKSQKYFDHSAFN